MPPLHLLILSCFVAGVQFRIAEGLHLDSILVGNAVHFEPDPANIFDPDAIKIIDDPTQQFIGFVPREQTPIVKELLEKGLAFTAEVTGRSMDIKKGKAIIVQVRLV